MGEAIADVLLGDVEPQKLIETLLREIADRSPDNLSDDDVTVLVVRANGRQPQRSWGEKLRAMFRLGGSLIRSIDPRAERAPLPDANLANIGGAIIPALGRRWRAKTQPVAASDRNSLSARR